MKFGQSHESNFGLTVTKPDTHHTFILFADHSKFRKQFGKQCINNLMVDPKPITPPVDGFKLKRSSAQVVGENQT
jgi:hypothetical protein